MVGDAAVADDAEEGTLPSLTDGEPVRITAVAVRAAKTRPPARYSEGTLIQAMKNAASLLDDSEFARVLKQASGLGTAATRDAIIEALKHHGYLRRAGTHLVPTDKGLALVAYLEQTAPETVDIETTARWEARLDMVAVRGGGRAFTAEIVARVRQLVSILRSAASPALVHPPTEKSTMQDSAVRKPTDKMIEFARSIAARMGAALPEEALASFDACREFIDNNKAAVMGPTDKQLSFANTIAQRKGISIPADVARDGRALSKWIDENK